MTRYALALAAASLLSGGSVVAQAGSTLPLRQQQSVLTEEAVVPLDEARVLTWSSPAPDAINAHIVRAPDGLVLFDTLRRSDQTENLIRVLDDLGGAPKAILITHAHTDHYGGLSFVRERYGAVPVHGTEAIQDEIRDDVYPDNARRRAMFGARFPTQETIDRHLPTELAKDGEPFEVAGLKVVPLAMGGSESPAAVVYHLPELNAAIVGDLVNVLTVSAPTVSLDGWLGQLDRLEEALPSDTTLYVGHGPSGPAAPLIADQRDYLVTLRDLVIGAAADDEGVTAAETDSIVRTMRLAYPHHRGAAFLPPEALIAESVGWVAQQIAVGDDADGR